MTTPSDAPPISRSTAYYRDKLRSLGEVFGTPIELTETALVTPRGVFPVVNDVILAVPPESYPAELRRRLGLPTDAEEPPPADSAAAIRETFGAEWQRFARLHPEHRRIVDRYFDLIDLDGLAGSRVCDLGCGMGRFSARLAPWVRELVLVDFSQAIFVARRNLASSQSAIFVLADIERLPFADDMADLVICLGVLHHLATPALDAVTRLAHLAPRLLVYLYYALDNRPVSFRWLLAVATALRRRLARVRSPLARAIWTELLLWGSYAPWILVGRAMRWSSRGARLPLVEAYGDASWRTIRQDVYDRFFTGIEQRFSRRDIESRLGASFSRVRVSDQLPYWHFLCER